jgi:hypothetical protein
MKTDQKPCLSSSTIKENVIKPENQWLKPSEVAKILGLDEKWLAAAREGRKGIEGPPFVKLGSGKTSPIRYPIDKLTIWMDSFHTQSSNYSRFSKYSDFQKSALPNDIWPFVLYQDGSIDEIFISINDGRFEKEYPTRQVIWLAKSSLPL